MERNRKNIVTGCLCALGCEILYGLSYMFTKQATEAAGPFALLGWRFLLAFLVMSVLVQLGAVKVNLKGRNLKLLLPVALANPCIYFIAETIGIRQTTSTESGVFLACIPVISLAASAVILKKKPTGLQMAGILITLVGVSVTVFAVGVSSSLSLTGYLCLAAAVLAYALYCVSVEKAEAFTSAEITYAMLAAGAGLFLLLALVEGAASGTLEQLVLLPFREKDFLAAVLYQGIGCSIVAFLLSNVAIAKIGVNRTSSFIGVSTVVSVIAGAAILKEPFTLYQMIGTVVIIVGVYVANAEQKS